MIADQCREQIREGVVCVDDGVVTIYTVMISKWMKARGLAQHLFLLNMHDKNGQGE